MAPPSMVPMQGDFSTPPKKKKAKLAVSSVLMGSTTEVEGIETTKTLLFSPLAV